MLIFNSESLICPKCNIISNIMYIETESDETKKYSENDNMLRIAGKEAHRFTKMIFSISNYKTTRNKSTEKQFNKINYDCETNKFPQQVINNARDLFQKIQEYGYVLRARVRKGTMAACLYYECKRAGMTKKQKEIADILNIQEKFIRSGEKLLLNLNSINYINIPIENSDGKNYISNYLEMLSINNYYFDFINEIFNICNNIYYDKTIKNYNKCIAIIYLLLNAKLTYKIKDCNKIILENNDNDKNLFITNDKNKNEINISNLINTECKVQKINYFNYYKFLITNRKKFKNVFIKYKIPYPVKIKNKIIEINNKKTKNLKKQKNIEFRYLSIYY